MILTGTQITREVKRGAITISHFDEAFVEPNSYGFHLGNVLCVYRNPEVDAYGAKNVDEIPISESGYTLEPNQFYLGYTLERMGGESYASELYARFSTSACGIFLQTSAPLGHTGAIINWTLEIVVAQPVRVYPGMLIGKICFWKNYGQILPYDGRYLKSTKAVPSLLSSGDQ
jgi:dCTP deaminase